MNLRQIYTNAGRLVNIIADNEEMDSNALNTCAFQIQMIFEAWSLNPRIQFKRDVSHYTTNGTDTFTLPVRPIRIHSVQWAYEGSNVLYNLNQITETDFYSINFRNITAPPNRFYWNHETSLKFFPIPAANGQLTIVSEMPLVIDTTDFDTDLSLPPGYAHALVYTLASMLIDQYGFQDATGIREQAAQLVNMIQAQSTRLGQMKTDSARMFMPRGSAYVPLINR